MLYKNIPYGRPRKYLSRSVHSNFDATVATGNAALGPAARRRIEEAPHDSVAHEKLI